MYDVKMSLSYDTFKYCRKFLTAIKSTSGNFLVKLKSQLKTEINQSNINKLGYLVYLRDLLRRIFPRFI